uniref:7TM GPCR serpentine receptor class x (Srx) domain-containing protein n=1 Tax=Acrobeloides nanus TaxID=290746 RepID=A0A914DU52_9BILA
MFWIGVLDIMEIPNINILAGYSTITGDFFCLNPIWNYVLGSVSLANWFGASYAAILLAINRCLETCAPRYASKLFDGKKTLVWLLFPTGFWFYTLLFQLPCIYSPEYFACFFDPYFGTEFHDPIKFANYYHAFHDTFVFVVLIILYVIICIGIWVKYKQVKSHSTAIKQQRIVSGNSSKRFSSFPYFPHSHVSHATSSKI